METQQFINMQKKKELGGYPATLTSPLVNNPYIVPRIDVRLVQTYYRLYHLYRISHFHY